MDEVVLGLVVIIALVIYMVPTIIAFQRQHVYKWVIAAVNVALGATMIGWAVALIWAVYPSEKSLIDPVLGNPTGMGLRNAGDTIGSDVQGAIRGFQSEQDITEKIRVLNNMYAAGHITEEEFKAQKKRILEGL